MGHLTAYADALGIKPKVSANPPAGSAIVTAEQQQPDTHDGSAADIAELQQAIASAPDAASKQTLTALLQQKTAKANQAGRMSPYAAALGLGAPESPQAPRNYTPKPGEYIAGQGASAIPGKAGVAPTPQVIQQDAPESLWDKAVGVGEAALTAGTGAAASIYAPLAGIATHMRGGNLQDATNEALEANTYAPRTQAGQRYAENVGEVASNLVPLAGLAKIGAPGAVRNAATVVADKARSMEGVRASIEGPKAPPVAPAATAAAPEAFKPPTLKDASPELQKAAVGKANDAVMKRHVEADTLLVPGQLTEGQAKLDPTLISQEMNGRGKGKAAPVSPEFYKEQGRVVAQNVEAQRAKAAPDVPPDARMPDHGQVLVDAYKQADEPVRADITAKYKALADANGGDLPLSGQSFVTAADAALKKENRTRFVPAEVQGILGDLREGGPMTFADFEAYRTILAEQARKADRAGDGTASYAVGLVREALESLPMDGEAAALKPLADAARGAAKARFDALRADPAYKAAVNDTVAMGEPSPLADKFFPAYVIKAPRSNVALMRQKLGENPIAGQTIAAGTLDHLKAALKPDLETGKFNQASYNKALQSLEPRIGLLLDPEVAYQTKALGEFAKNAQTDVRGAYVNSSNTATALVAEGAKASAEHGTNMLFGGLPVGTVTRKVGGILSDAVGTNRAAKKATKPGAGMTKGRDFPGVEPE